MKLEHNPNIRIARKSDAVPLAHLSGGLGYPTTIQEIENRLNNLFSLSDNAIYIAEIDFVVGWIHVAVRQTLESNAYVEICGFVIAEKYRNSGIGSLLAAKAEDWAREKGYSRVRVRTNILRKEARSFYKKLGYHTSKTQEVFEKIISAA